jgi:DNA-binding MarR family transcriptional regulator
VAEGDPKTCKLRPQAENGFAGKSVDVVESIYRARRLREDAFGKFAGNFREPTWDILLDLYLAAAKGRAVSVSSACIGSSAPQTTAIRHLTLLEKAGLVTRTANPHDNRAGIVTLTDEAVRRIDDWARHVRSSWRAAVMLPDAA